MRKDIGGSHKIDWRDQLTKMRRDLQRTEIILYKKKLDQSARAKSS